MTGLTRQVLQTALEVEMADHLGYDKHEFEGRNGLNSRNGSTPKTVRTEIGEITVQVPRDRQGTFEPAIVPKYQRRIAGFDEAVISLYAKGMTTGDIQAHLSGDASGRCKSLVPYRQRSAGRVFRLPGALSAERCRYGDLR